MPTSQESTVKAYRNGEIIVQQGAPGECMYIVQSGRVEIIRLEGRKEFCLAELGPGGIFGEIVLFEKTGYPALVRALGSASVEAINREQFMRRVKENPAFALTALEQLSRRAKRSDDMLVQIADVEASIAYL